MSLSKDASKEQVEITTTVTEVDIYEKRSKKRACVAFVKKWWWALLIAQAVILLVSIPPLFLVGIPRIIQHKVDAAVLTVDGISVLNSRTDAVTISINSSVSSSNSIHATIDAFTAIMYLEDQLPHTPFATLQMPQTETGLSIVNITQELSTVGETAQAYLDYNAALLWNETVRMTVKGETYVHVKGLKAAKVNFEKTVTLPGLNGFKGLHVTSAEIATKGDSRGDNFHGFVDIPNASILTLEIGNATFANNLNGTRIGTLFIDNMFLQPGINNLSIRANITQAPVLLAVTSLPYCQTGILPFELFGESVVNHGQSLPYFAHALSLHAQISEVDVGTALQKTLGTKIATCPKTKSG